MAKTTNDGKRGGMLKGKSHADGGIKAVVTDAGDKPVELEGGEAIINKRTMKSDKVITVTGTPCEIASKINSMDGNGVEIPCGSSGSHNDCPSCKFARGGSVIVPYVAPEGYVFTKVGSHRASDKVSQLVDEHISLYTFGGARGSAGTSTIMLSELDYEKIKNIKSVGKPMKKIGRGGETWFTRRESKKLHDLFVNANKEIIDGFAESVKEAERRSELSKGIEVEQEHKETLEEIASGEITVDEAIEKTAEDHLKENPEYYTELEESGVETNVVTSDSTQSDEANAEFDNAKAQFIERLGFYEKSKDKTALRVMEMFVSEMEKQLEFVPSRVIEYVNIVKGLPKSPYRVAMSFLTNYDYVNESTKSVAKWMNENDINPYEIVGIETYKAPKVKLFNRSYSDKTFMDIHSTFASEDGTIRINLMGTHFDGDVAVTTDAHAMLVTNKTTTDGKPNGTYCWTKKCWQANPSGNIDDKYPDWRSVIAEPGFWVNLNAQAILSWIETCEKGGILNNVTFSRIAIKTDIIDDNNEAFEIGFQLLLLRDTIDAMLRLGHSELKIGLSAPSRAAIIAPSKDFATWASKEGSFRELTKVNTDFALIMPVMLGGFSGADEAPYNWDEPKSTKYFLPTYDISTNCAIHPITLKHTCFDEQKREKDNLEAKIKELEAKVAEQKAVDVVVPEPVAEPQVDVEHTETVVIDEDAEAKAKAASARIRILKLKKLKKK